MARDYKYRAQSKAPSYHRGQNKSGRHDSSVGVLRWMLITALIIAFVVFLVYLRGTGSQSAGAPSTLQPLAMAKPAKTEPRKTEQAKQKKMLAVAPVHQSPQFDFYTILPEKEVVVPDYEIKTRTREERVGEAKAAKYIVQAGSFKEFRQADALRAKLALMGIESRVEKAKVGNVIWHRVKLGPYSQMSSVSTIKARLKQSGLDVVVTEIRG